MSSNQSSGTLNVAITAARDAGKIIAQNIQHIERVKVTQKSRYEMVSEIDILSEKCIIAALEHHFSDYNIISEESGDKQKDSEYCWIIDPLDGTHNFVHGHPHCCVSIALKKDNEVIQAVVYDPFRNELFTASKGSGAQLDGRRIRVSENSRLTESLLCTGFPYTQASDTKPWLKSFATIMPRAQSIHRTGSSVLDLAYLACGRYDGFWEYGLQQWDIAAGALLVTEAGGSVTDAAGNLDYFKSGNVVAGNAKVHEKLLHLINHNQA